MDTSPDAITLADVRKAYGKQAVLDGVSLAVSAGECFGLVGVNGAGKTTLIKGLLDLCQIDSGTIHIFGAPHRDVGARNRLAYLPERFVPPYYLNGRAFLEYMLALHGVPFDLMRVEQVFRALDLDSAALQRSVRAYSKGMAQKLGLAAALLSGKDLLVLDEPMSGLDPKARALLKQQFAALKQQGRTVFLSTHMLADVQALCDRMAILHGGRLQFLGTPAQCCAQYGSDDLEQAYLRCITTDSSM